MNGILGKTTVALILGATLLAGSASAQIDPNYFPLRPIGEVDPITNELLPNRSWVTGDPTSGRTTVSELTNASTTIRGRRTVLRENLVDDGADSYFNYWSVQDSARVLLHGFYRPDEDTGIYYDPPIVWATLPKVGSAGWSDTYDAFTRRTIQGRAIERAQYEVEVVDEAAVLNGLPFGTLEDVRVIRRTYTPITLERNGQRRVYSPTGRRLPDAGGLGRSTFVTEEWTWLAPEIGIVQQAFFDQSTVTMQLISTVPSPDERPARDQRRYELRSWSDLKSEFRGQR